MTVCKYGWEQSRGSSMAQPGSGTDWARGGAMQAYLNGLWM